VACTRAKDHLYLTYPEFVPRHYMGDTLGRPSSFIEEIRGANVFDVGDIITNPT
jgi:superfamily I DNA/RNA helicase